VAKEDYYKILGVGRDATEEAIKKPTESLPSNTILIETREARRPRRNLKRSVRPTRC